MRPSPTFPSPLKKEIFCALETSEPARCHGTGKRYMPSVWAQPCRARGCLAREAMTLTIAMARHGSVKDRRPDHRLTGLLMQLPAIGLLWSDQRNSPKELGVELAFRSTAPSPCLGRLRSERRHPVWLPRL